MNRQFWIGYNRVQILSSSSINGILKELLKPNGILYASFKEGNSMCKKTIRVVAAIIRKDDLLFATQRGYGDFKDWWEFPGGKIETGETPEEAIVREIREELNTEIVVDGFLTRVDYDYPEFHLTMDCFWCSIKGGHLQLLEHEAAKWLPQNDLRQVNWLPADVLVVDAIERCVNT